MSNIYLDYAATAPVREDVAQEMRAVLTSYWRNPSALYASGESAKLAQYRQQIAEQLQVRPQEIIFTAGATEANNLIINGVMKQYPEGNLLISCLEHDSILLTAQQYSCQIIPVKDSKLDLNSFSGQVDDKTVLVSCILVSNETGAILPVRELAKLVQKIRAKRRRLGNTTPLYLHTDVAQGQYLNIMPQTLGVDALTINSSKLGGPKQAGCLYINSKLKLASSLFGGGQERGLRPGTEALHQIAGFTSALISAQSSKQTEFARLKHLQQNFETNLLELGAKIVQAEVERSPHISMAIFLGNDNESLAYKLLAKQIEVGTGSACHATNGQLSHSLESLGYSRSEIRACIRFSYGYQTTQQELDETVSALKELL
ncbi:aminotransferase class V-fold PLP-dependent enzyme [Candidatus Saccharibacteria bacterium]|nr:aminotransferase class V-fold PLP-dependent enzyme [Candidatus Saccharibacteria bacterium]